MKIKITDMLKITGEFMFYYDAIYKGKRYQYKTMGCNPLSKEEYKKLVLSWKEVDGV